MPFGKLSLSKRIFGELHLSSLVRRALNRSNISLQSCVCVPWSTLIGAVKARATKIFGHLAPMPTEKGMEKPICELGTEQEARRIIAERMHHFLWTVKVNSHARDPTPLCAWWRLDAVDSPQLGWRNEPLAEAEDSAVISSTYMDSALRHPDDDDAGKKKAGGAKLEGILSHGVRIDASESAAFLDALSLFDVDVQLAKRCWVNQKRSLALGVPHDVLASFEEHRKKLRRKENQDPKDR